MSQELCDYIKAYFVKKPIVYSVILLILPLGLILGFSTVGKTLESKKLTQRAFNLLASAREQLNAGRIETAFGITKTALDIQHVPEIQSFYSQFEKYYSEPLLKANFKNLSSEDLGLLIEGKLQAQFIENEVLNKSYMYKLSVELAKQYIQTGKISEASKLIQSLEKKTNIPELIKLRNDLSKYQSNEYLHKIFNLMSIKDYQLLKEGKLKDRFLDDLGLNKLFIQKLYDNRAVKEKLLAKKKAERSSRDLVKKIIKKYSKPYTVLDITTAKGALNIHAPSATNAKERGATALAAYEEHKYRGITQVAIAPCDEGECVQAYASYAGGVIGLVNAPALTSLNQLEVSASNMQVQSIDIFLLIIKARLMTNDPDWYDYSRDMQYQAIYDSAMLINPYLVSSINLGYVRKSMFLRDLGLVDCLKLKPRNHKVIYNIYNEL